MSDSKGAAIDGILDEFEVVLHNDGPDDKAKRKAKKAILALLAQEVNKAQVVGMKLGLGALRNLSFKEAEDILEEAIRKAGLV